jgi:hypothetical protein
MGRSNVSTPMTFVMSEIWPTSSLAATRGATFLPAEVAGEEDVAVVRSDREDLRREVFSEAVGELLAVGMQ